MNLSRRSLHRLPEDAHKRIKILINNGRTICIGDRATEFAGDLLSIAKKRKKISIYADDVKSANIITTLKAHAKESGRVILLFSTYSRTYSEVLNFIENRKQHDIKCVLYLIDSSWFNFHDSCSNIFAIYYGQ